MITVSVHASWHLWSASDTAATFSSESEPCPEHFLEFYHPTDVMTEILGSLPLSEFGLQSSPEEVESQLPSSFLKLQNSNSKMMTIVNYTIEHSQVPFRSVCVVGVVVVVAVVMAVAAAAVAVAAVVVPVERRKRMNGEHVLR